MAKKNKVVKRMRFEKGLLETPYFLFYRAKLSDCFTGSIPCEFLEPYNVMAAFKSIMDNGYFYDEAGRRYTAFSGFVTMAITGAIIETGERIML